MVERRGLHSVEKLSLFARSGHRAGGRALSRERPSSAVTWSAETAFMAVAFDEPPSSHGGKQVYGPAVATAHTRGHV